MKLLCLVVGMIAIGASRVLAQAITPMNPPALVPLEMHPPSYPLPAQRAGLRGDVTVQLSILPSGAVSTTTVLTSIAPVLDSASTAAAAKWRFAPIVGSETRSFNVVFEFRTTNSSIQYLCDVSTVTVFPPNRVRLLGVTFREFTR